MAKSVDFYIKRELSEAAVKILSLLILVMFSTGFEASGQYMPPASGKIPKEPELTAPSETPEPDEPQPPDETYMDEYEIKEPPLIELGEPALSRGYEREPEPPPLFEPDLRDLERSPKEPEPLIIVPRDGGFFADCPKGLKCD